MGGDGVVQSLFVISISAQLAPDDGWGEQKTQIHKKGENQKPIRLGVKNN